MLTRAEKGASLSASGTGPMFCGASVFRHAWGEEKDSDKQVGIELAPSTLHLHDVGAGRLATVWAIEAGRPNQFLTSTHNHMKPILVGILGALLLAALFVVTFFDTLVRGRNAMDALGDAKDGTP
jgi:hypothetical protein